MATTNKAPFALAAAAAFLTIAFAGCLEDDTIEMKAGASSNWTTKNNGSITYSCSSGGRAIDLTITNNDGAPFQFSWNQFSAAYSDGSAGGMTMLQGPNAIAPHNAIELTVYFCGQGKDVTTVYLHEEAWADSPVIAHT